MISVQDLATELRITGGNVLSIADWCIDRDFKAGGLPSIEGMSYQYRTRTGTTYTYLTVKLADAVRARAKEIQP